MGVKLHIIFVLTKYIFKEMTIKIDFLTVCLQSSHEAVILRSLRRKKSHVRFFQNSASQNHGKAPPRKRPL